MWSWGPTEMMLWEVLNVVAGTPCIRFLWQLIITSVMALNNPSYGLRVLEVRRLAGVPLGSHQGAW